MSLIITFDTETTGLPEWKRPSNDQCQPHLVELAALLYRPSGELADSFSAIIRPDGWLVTPEITAVHGITHEQAMDTGIAEADALEAFLALYAQAGVRVAHNLNFDDRILRIALIRHCGYEAADRYKDATERFCTANRSRATVGLKKVPTLGEAYQHFTGEELNEAHRALPDATACARIYFALQGAISPTLTASEA